MRILVAGSSGLIGSAVTSRLREAGHEVRRLVRREAEALDEYGWDPTSGEIEQGAFDGVYAVLNFCGAPLLPGRWSAERKQVITDSRVEPTEVLAESVRRNQIPVLVNASAVGYYGDGGDARLDESAPNGTGFLAELCRKWEQAARAAESESVRVVRVRTGLVLARGGLLGTLKPLFWLGLGGRLGAGEQYMPWIALDDVATAVQFAVENDTVDGPVNLAAPQPVTNATFTRALGRHLNRPTPWWVPAFGMRLLLGQAAEEMVLVSQRAVPHALQYAGFGFTHRDLDDALGDIV